MGKASDTPTPPHRRADGTDGEKGRDLKEVVKDGEILLGVGKASFAGGSILKDESGPSQAVFFVVSHSSTGGSGIRSRRSSSDGLGGDHLQSIAVGDSASSVRVGRSWASDGVRKLGGWSMLRMLHGHLLAVLWRKLETRLGRVVIRFLFPIVWIIWKPWTG
ncbi:hypothetical protein COCNU_scaffold016239G000020 [Cocos nucifera]|nr:hypothetical protein [Cocos nucifera]